MISVVNSTKKKFFLNKSSTTFSEVWKIARRIAGLLRKFRHKKSFQYDFGTSFNFSKQSSPLYSFLWNVQITVQVSKSAGHFQAVLTNFNFAVNCTRHDILEHQLLQSLGMKHLKKKSKLKVMKMYIRSA